VKKSEFLHLSDKLDMIDDKIYDMETVLKLQELNLREHMKRTALLEKQVSPLNKFMYSAYGIISFCLFVAAMSAIFKK
jgi:hypothetical protein